MLTLTCPIDGTRFTATRTSAKYCSEACKQKAKRAESKTTAPEAPGRTLVDAVALVPTLAKKEPAVKPAADLGYTIIPMSELPRTTFIPTGFTELDAIIQGIPRKRITEIYGPASAGKTTLMLTMVAGFELNVKTLYLDLENAIDAEWSQNLGITTVNTQLANPMLLEDAAQLTLDSIGQYDLIVFDSVASALYKTEETNEFGTANIGIKAKLMTQFMRKLAGPLARTDCAVVFINQEKPVIGNMYGPQTYTPGGKALEYASSLRLRLTSNKADRVIKDGENIGKKVHAEVTKNKVGRPYQSAEFAIKYA